MYRTDYTPYKLTKFISDFFEIDIWDRICQNPDAIDLIKNKMSSNHEMINFELLLQNENVYQLFVEEGNILNDFLINKQKLPDSCLHELNFCISGTTHTLARNISRHASSEAISYLHQHAPYLLDIKYLSANPEAIDYLLEYPEEIDWSQLSLNHNALTLLKDHPDKIDWNKLSLNSSAGQLLAKNTHLINWKNLSSNPGAIQILEQNPHKINWEQLSKNPQAIHLLEQNVDKISWYSLSENPNSVKLLDKYFRQQHICRFLYKMPNIEPFRHLVLKYYHIIRTRVNLDFFEIPLLTFLIPSEKDLFLPKYIKTQLNLNSRFLELNPRAIHFIEEHLDRIDYFNLCKNPNAIHLIENKRPLDMCLLSRKPAAISILEQKKYAINWKNLSINTEASHLMEYNLDKIDWDDIASNMGAINLIKDNLHRLSKRGWRILSKNPQALPILKENVHKIDWKSLSLNPNAIELLEKNIPKIDWIALCKNPKGVPIIENHLHKLDESCWKALSSNPGAIHLLERHPHQINWKSLVNNPQASRLLEKEIINNNPLIIRNIAMIARHPNNVYLLQHISSFFFKFSYINEFYPVDRILADVYDVICEHPHAFTWLRGHQQFLKWFKNRSKTSRYHDFYLGSFRGNMSFLKNPAIFEIDYLSLQQKMEPLKEELMQKCFHPQRLLYYLETYEYDIGEDNYTETY